MRTYEQVMGAHSVEIPAHLITDAEVPILSGLQVQGDVAIVPHRHGKGDTILVPAEGVAVVRGESGGNTHLLVADGPVVWCPSSNELTMGQVTVPKGAVAYLLHPEHGAMGLAPGSYLIRRQREMADEIRRVSD
jgi:hypothetical protein